MNVQEIREQLEKTEDKLSMFTDSEKILHEYNITQNEFCDLIRDFLSDEDILKLFDYEFHQTAKGPFKFKIISIIKNENIILQILNNDIITSDIENDYLIEIIMPLSDEGKKKILYNQAFIEKHELSNKQLVNIIYSLGDKIRTEVLADKELIKEKLHINDYIITDLIKGLPSEKLKKEMSKLYKLSKNQELEIIITYSNETKLKIVLEEKNYNKWNKIKILSSVDIEALSEFLVNNKEFCTENDIRPYQVIMELDSEKQKGFIEKIFQIDLTSRQKKEILAMLKDDVKRDIDTTNFPKEYIPAINMQKAKIENGIILDLEKDLEDYRELDNLIKVNPEQFTEEQKAKFIKLCDICPDLLVVTTLESKNNGKTRKSADDFISTGNEYKEAEEWIDFIINNINPEYSKAQKMAIIDYAIGKKISYSPDFDTEIYNPEDARALWKIISSGYGVCNGIARLEQYMLAKVGIESEIISGSEHAFLKIKDIELPLANGEIVKGNTILDPTWNLASHRFGGKPENFCIDYEEARKNDIDSKGKDHMCHKNDEDLKDATLKLDDKSLRQLFASVGLADKDGQFPITNLLEKSKEIDEIYANDPNQNIKNQFLLLSKACPEFATCQDSSMSMLETIFEKNENLKFKKCVINRVYARDDEQKSPILYVYINSDELGKKFYFADKNEGQFIELTLEEFIKKFECYEKDLEELEGIRPWESEEQEKRDINLATSSGDIVAEGEVR